VSLFVIQRENASADDITFIMLGRKNLYFQHDIFNPDGTLSPQKIWENTKKFYGDYCPDY
jgi:hypothetical protein